MYSSVCYQLSKGVASHVCRLFCVLVGLALLACLFSLNVRRLVILAY